MYQKNKNFLINPLNNNSYPTQPNASKCCGTNETVQTLQGQNNRVFTLDPPVEFTTTASGPTSIKHLYSGRNFYPYRRITRPKDTLYGHDFSQYLRSNGKKISNHYLVYPFQDLNVKEIEDFVEGWTLPIINTELITKKNVAYGSASLNSRFLSNPG